MRRYGRLATLLVMLGVLLLCLVLPVMADENAPLIITDTPTPTAEVPGEVPTVVPEASTLLLLGGSATALAAYVSLQIQARRRKP